MNREYSSTMGGFFVRWSKVWNRRLQSILAISLLSTYVLSFLFEGQILYGLLDMNGIPASGYSRLAMVAHLLGLFTSGFFIHSTLQARFVMVFGLSVAYFPWSLFYFRPPSFGRLDCLLEVILVELPLQPGDTSFDPFQKKGNVSKPAPMY